MLEVRLYTVRKRHGGFDNHCTLVFDPTKRIRSLSRCFYCECGEPLHDGDQVDDALYEQGRYVHVNCV